MGSTELDGRKKEEEDRKRRRRDMVAAIGLVGVTLFVRINYERHKKRS